MDSYLDPRFGSSAAPYDQLDTSYDSPENTRFYEAAADHLSHLLPMETLLQTLGTGQTRASALDLACGTGISLQSFVKRAPEFSWQGVDASARMLERARLRPSLAAIPLKQGWAESLPFADQSLDLIASSFSFHWFGEGAWTEIRRVLKPGGWLVASTPLRGLRPDHPGNELLFRNFLRTFRESRRAMAEVAPLNANALGLTEAQVREHLGDWSQLSFRSLELEEEFKDLDQMERTLLSRGSLRAVLGGAQVSLSLSRSEATPGVLPFLWRLGLFRAQRP